VALSTHKEVYMSSRTEKLLNLKYNIEMLLESSNGNTLNKLRSFVQKKPQSEGIWKHIISSIGNKLSDAASSLKSSIFGHMESNASEQSIYEKVIKKLEKIQKEVNNLKDDFKKDQTLPTSHAKIILFAFVLYCIAKIISHSKEVASKIPNVLSNVKNGIVKAFKDLFDSKKPLADRVFEFISTVILSPFEIAFKSLPDDLFKHLLNVGALTFGAAVVMLVFKG
jgi:hypothetical protein